MKFAKIIENSNGKVTVELLKNEDCFTCKLCSPDEKKIKLTFFDKSFKGKENDFLKIQDENSKSWLLALFLPALALVFGVFLGEFLFNSQTKSLLFGLFNLLLSLLVLKILDFFIFKKPANYELIKNAN